LASRCTRVRQFAAALYGHREELAQCVVRETGKPYVEALFSDVLISIDLARYYAANASGMLRETRVPHHNLALKAKSGTLCYEPCGVIGIIAPWNYPLAIPIGQIVPALVAGNAVVFKCSELTPACGE